MFLMIHVFRHLPEAQLITVLNIYAQRDRIQLQDNHRVHYVQSEHIHLQLEQFQPPVVYRAQLVHMETRLV
jgi:hypothetical protein